jgi:YHS domain-containing protein
MFVSRLKKLLVGVLILLPVAHVAQADGSAPFLDGYSPVSYFTVNMAEKGSEEFPVSHKGRVYYLTSAKQVELFNKTPDKYSPKFDVCPYSLTLGKVLPLDPMNFKVFGNSLLLFHKSDAGDGRAAWENSDLNDDELIKLANKQFNLLKF